MALDVELYRRTLYVPIVPRRAKSGAQAAGKPGGKTHRRISVFDIGPEDATSTLVFIHGFGGRSLQWINQLRHFGQTARVIAADLRGHSHSDDPNEEKLTMDGLVEDVETVLRELGVQTPVALISHSFGGAIAAEYALRYPQRVAKLVLMGVPTRYIVHPIVRPVLSLPAAWLDPLKSKLGLTLYASVRTMRRMHDGAMSPWRGEDSLPRLRVPTLVMLGQRDRVFSRSHYAGVPRLVPNAQQVTIPVSAHLMQLERPDAVNRAIRRFLEPKDRAGRAAVLETMASVTSGGNSTNGHGASPATPSSRSGAAQRLSEMPWLQHYDNEVPQELVPSNVVLPDLLGNAAREFRDRAALIFFGQRISYRELDRLTNRFAHALRTLGIQPGERVAIVLPNVPQCVIAFYGALKAGAVVVMGSSLATEDEFAYQLRDSDARAVVTVDNYRAMMQRAAAGTAVKHLILTDLREYLPLGARLRLASLLPPPPARDQSLTTGTTERTEKKRERRSGASLGSEEPEHGDGGLKSPPGGSDHADFSPSAPSAGTSVPRPSSASSASVSTTSAVESPSVSSVPSGVQSSGPIAEEAFQRLLRDASGALVPVATKASDLALLQYTSGTADLPKGVMLSHGNLVFNVIQNRHWMPEARRGAETILAVLPLSHIYGITAGMNMAFAVAGSLVLLPTTRTKEILKAIKRHSPTIFPAVPATYMAVANFPHVRRYGVASIRVCVSGSAPLPVEVQEAFEKLTRGRVVEGYGLTEASPITHLNPLSGERRVGSIGVPLPSTQARVVHLETGEPLPPGEVGELLVRGHQVMQGYWKRPDETAQALADGWLRTGDLARMDEDGFFSIVDRKKDMILAGPYSVYPRDVEEVLYEHPKVFEAVVVAAREGDNPNPIVKAIVVLKRGEKATAEELLAFARERLEAYKVPRQIEFRRELPKNLVGKVLRRLLVEA